VCHTPASGFAEDGSEVSAQAFDGTTGSRNEAGDQTSLFGALPPPSETPASIPGYLLLGELGSGGMGVVYKARQLGLNRLVALKMTRSGLLAGSDEVVRFQVEAEAVARLRHPNIVSIYEVGQVYGQPYFSLEYVEGGSLARRLVNSALPPPEAARLVETLAQAMETAHRAGVIHRDLKPANVLLTAEGEPKITDFGLAKFLGGDSGRTESGVIIGTPSYMAPEQARGKAAQIGPATDVWALGTILYECLTGRPPFRGPTSLDTIQQVVADDPVPPARLQPMVPRDLETVCLKCLEKDPKKRYGSAGELADDLGRFRAGEPIRARPTSRWERLGKWVRRRPAAAALIAVSIAAAVSLVAVNFWYLGQLHQAVDVAEQRRQDALRGQAEADAQRVRAEAYYDKALEVVDRLLTRVGQERLAKVPGFEEERRKLLEDALEFYKGFLQEKDNPDPRVRRETAHAYHRAGTLRRLLGRLDEAEASFQEALALERPLVEEVPNSSAETRELGTLLNDLGLLYFQRRRLQQAQHTFDEALAVCEERARQHSEDPDNRKLIAQTCHRLAAVHRVADRPQQAEDFSRRALQTQQALVRDFPKVADYQYGLATIWQGRGNAFYFSGRLDEAAGAWKQAVAAYEPVVKDHPEMVEARQGLAGALDNLGVALERTNQMKDAEAVRDRGRQLFEGLAREYPKVPEYRFELAMCWDNLGNLRDALGRPTEAEAAYAKALELYERLVAEQPGEAPYRHHLASCFNNLGILHQATDRPARAEEYYRKAIAVGEALVQASPQVPEFQATLTSSYMGLGWVYARTARYDQAEPELRKALAVAQPLAAANPKSDQYQSLIAHAHLYLGEAHLGPGRLGPAEAEYREAMKCLEQLVKSHPETKDFAVDLGDVLRGLGSVRMKAGKAEEALDWYAKALPILEGVLRANPKDRPARKVQAAIHAGRARALRPLHRHPEALQEWDKALPLAERKYSDEYRADRARTLMHLGRTDDGLREAADLAAKTSLEGAALYRLAGVHALAAAANKADPAAADAQVTKALELLNKAREAGYFADPANQADLKEDEDFAVLRTRPEFRRLVADAKK
jgi:serine/threonine-protein kinase